MLLWEEEFCEELVKQVIPDARGASSCTHLLLAHDIRVDTKPDKRAHRGFTSSATITAT